MAVAAAVPRISLRSIGATRLICESKDRRAISSLAENLRIVAAQSQLRRPSSKQRAEKESRKFRGMAAVGGIS
jgi:hypothetical protein